MRTWGEALDSAGWDVSIPLLPGHGTSWQDMSRTRWTEWYQAVATELDHLSRTSETVVVCGLSMGGTLSLALAAEKPQLISAVALVNPALTVPSQLARFARFIAPVIPSVPSIGGDIAKPGGREESYERTPLRSVAELRQLTRHVQRQLSSVTAPLLLMTSTVDHVVNVHDSDQIAAHVRSRPLRRLTLAHSFHVATQDYDAELIHKSCIEFFEEVC